MSNNIKNGDKVYAIHLDENWQPDLRVYLVLDHSDKHYVKLLDGQGKEVILLKDHVGTDFDILWDRVFQNIEKIYKNLPSCIQCLQQMKTQALPEINLQLGQGEMTIE